MNAASQIAHHFSPFFPGLALAVIVIIALSGAKYRRTTIGRAFPYQRKQKLFSPAERSFLGVLEQVLGNQYRAFGKVRLSDIIQPISGLSNSNRSTALNRINSKHVDFLICDVETTRVIGVIELDDSSHKRASAARGDQVKDKALAVAGVTVVRIPIKRGYQLADVRERIGALLKTETES